MRESSTSHYNKQETWESRLLPTTINKRDKRVVYPYYNKQETWESCLLPTTINKRLKRVVYPTDGLGLDKKALKSSVRLQEVIEILNSCLFLIYSLRLTLSIYFFMKVVPFPASAQLRFATHAKLLYVIIDLVSLSFDNVYLNTFDAN